MGPNTYGMLESHGVEAPERAFCGAEGTGAAAVSEFQDAPETHAS